MQGKWWLELIERSTGLTWIIHCDTKAIAARTFKGMTNQEAHDWMDRLGVQSVQMYKKGVTFYDKRQRIFPQVS